MSHFFCFVLSGHQNSEQEQVLWMGTGQPAAVLSDPVRVTLPKCLLRTLLHTYAYSMPMITVL